jgi:hypothetical protein
MSDPREPNNLDETAREPTTEFSREPEEADDAEREPNTESVREPNTEV